MKIRLFLVTTLSIAATCLPPVACVAGDAHSPLRLVLVGDSTVCNYPANQPDRGWGQFVGESFRDGSVEVINLAAAGSSTKTFIEDGLWQKALAAKPDYVLIQFGHNDSHSSNKPEATEAATNYRD